MPPSKEALKRARDKYRSNPENRVKENTYNREWYQRNKLRKQIVSRLWRYDITKEEYDTLAIIQKGLCAICNELPKPKKRLSAPDNFVIDHCHTTGKVRGLLCDDCNQVLGRAKDNIEILKNAISYLEK